MAENGTAVVSTGTVSAIDDAITTKDATASVSSSTTITPHSSTLTSSSSSSSPKAIGKTSSKPKQTKRNFNVIHADSLPVTIYHAPPLIPHNPLSILHHIYLWLFPPLVSHDPTYIAYFSPLTGSVNVTDPDTMVALWSRGFWGKGSLSRSEPEWLLTEMHRRGYRGLPETSQMVTEKRRSKRKAFKKERELKEMEELERVKAEERRKKEEADNAEGTKIVVELEDEIKDVPATTEDERTTTNSSGKDSLTISDLSASGVLTPPPSVASDADKDAENQQTEEAQATEQLQHAVAIAPTPPEEMVPDAIPPPSPHTLIKCVRFDDSVTMQELPPSSSFDADTPSSSSSSATTRKPLENKEHLQLTLQEAFFLHFALGILEIRHASSTEAIPTPELLRLFRAYAHFPPSPLSPSDAPLNPDDPFLISYAVYHHFRSLGWVVKTGIKFGVDYLLYNRGPVFSHAEFGVIVIPSYERWNHDERNTRGKQDRSWSWLHSVTRVNSQVKKTVVFVYVDVPTVEEVDGWDKKGGIGLKGVLGRYGIKEVALRRWVPGRNRD